MNLKTLTIAAVLAALCALPLVSADDVEVTVGTRTVDCMTDNHVPPVLYPYVSDVGCSVRVATNTNAVDLQGRCGPIPPMFDGITVTSNCQVHLRLL